MTTKEVEELKQQQEKEIKRFYVDYFENERVGSFLIYTNDSIYRINKKDIVPEFSTNEEVYFESKTLLFNDGDGTGDTEVKVLYRITSESVQTITKEEKVDLLKTINSDYEASELETQKLNANVYNYSWIIFVNEDVKTLNFTRNGENGYTYIISNERTMIDYTVSEIGSSINLDDVQVGDTLRLKIKNGLETENIFDDVHIIITDEMLLSTVDFPFGKKYITTENFVELALEVEK